MKHLEAVSVTFRSVKGLHYTVIALSTIRQPYELHDCIKRAYTIHTVIQSDNGIYWGF